MLTNAERKCTNAMNTLYVRTHKGVSFVTVCKVMKEMVECVTVRYKDDFRTLHRFPLNCKQIFFLHLLQRCKLSHYDNEMVPWRVYTSLQLCVKSIFLEVAINEVAAAKVGSISGHRISVGYSDEIVFRTSTLVK